MALVCGISGEIPSVPVVSLKSKALFEKVLLEKWILENGVDPITKDPMTIDDVIELKVVPMPKPRPPETMGFPQLVGTMLEEWQNVMLYNHSLGNRLSNMKKELYTALYQRDAACRVISQLKSELVDLEVATKSVSDSVNLDPKREEETEESKRRKAESHIKEIALSLISSRRKNLKSSFTEIVSSDKLKSLQLVFENSSLHSPREGKICCVDAKYDSDLIVTGGADKATVLYDKGSQRVFNKIKAHAKRINSTRFCSDGSNDFVLSGSADSTISLWKYTLEHDDITKFDFHNSSVVNAIAHPTKAHMISGEQDYAWVLSDLNENIALKRVGEEGSTMGCLGLHPDGLILAASNMSYVDKKLLVWDVCSCENIASISGSDGIVSSIAFSENGYHLFSLQKTRNEEAIVSLWDLRKIKVVSSIKLNSSFRANTITLDCSGTYLAIGGEGLKIYSTKQWDIVKEIDISEADINGISFGRNANSLTTVGSDRFLRYFSF